MILGLREPKMERRQSCLFCTERWTMKVKKRKKDAPTRFCAPQSMTRTCSRVVGEEDLLQATLIYT